MAFQSKSLKTRVTLFTLTIFVVGIWSLAFYVSKMLRADMEQLLGEQKYSTVALIATNMNSELEERLRALEAVAKALAPQVNEVPSGLQAVLAGQQVLPHLFNGGTFATGLDGVAIADVPVSANRLGVSYADRDFIVSALKDGKSTIGRPVIGKKLQVPVIAMTTPMRDSNGKVVGALSGVINLGSANFIDKVTEGHYGETGRYMLVAAQHRLVVAPTTKERVMQALPAAGVNAMIDRFVAGFEGHTVYVNPQGKEVLASVKAMPVAGWFLLAELPTVDAFAPIRDMQRRMIVATIILTLLAGAICWWMLRRQLAPMFAAATTLAKLTESGQTLQPLPITRQDEVGELIAGFNRLLETLGKREDALKESEARFRGLTAMSSDFYWETDEEHRLTRRTQSEVSAGDEIAAPSPRLGQRRWEIPHTAPGEALWQQHREQLDAHLPFRNFEISRVRLNGKARHISISGAPVFDAAGVFKGYRGVGTDITERKEAEATIRELAFFDHLTGLPNRVLLTDRMKQAMTDSGRTRRCGAVIFIDLDHFKTLNDTLGHDMGDLLLKQVARRLEPCVRAGDTVARLGGDEFVVLLEGLGTTSREAAVQAESVGRKILSALGQSYPLHNQNYHSTPSIGITLFQGDQASIDDLMKQADLAMYQAKGGGRNTLRFFDPAMQTAVVARVAMEADLRTALIEQQFLLHYQPQVGARDEVTGAEALVRWQHPTRGLVSPAEFIPLAEETGLILELGAWVLKSACVQLALWAMREETAHLTVAVNVSAEQIRSPDFVRDVLAVVKSAGADPKRLKLELTESVLVDNFEDITGKMKVLRAEGVSFSLDDFGTGYSSLSYLKRLPLDQLKIDASFVRDVLLDGNDAAIARTIVALAANLGMGVIAEGVETLAQRDFLAKAGCQAYQGYFFSRPLPIASFEEFADRD